MADTFDYDEIGQWSETKLDIVKKYAEAYTTIMRPQTFIKKYLYVDAFAGPGFHVSERTGELVKGSPLNAIGVNSPFSEIHLIDADPKKVAELRRLASARTNVSVYKGDSNRVLLETVFPRCRYDDYCRALCLLDPYGLHVNWEVVATAGEMRSIEIFYNFMIMDANMNVLWRNPDKVDKRQVLRMDKVWGDHSWWNAAYVAQPTLFGDTWDLKEAGNQQIADAFRTRLHDVAGFRFVPEPIPMRNSQGAIIYYLYFASQNEAGAKIVENIFNTYRTKGVA